MPEPNPNSEAGFNELLAQQAGVELTPELREALAEQPSTSIAEGLEFASESAQPRNEQGQFTSRESQPEAGEERVAPTAQEQELPEEPEAGVEEPDELTSLRQQLEEAQKLIGRQSAEVAESRQASQQAAELRERLARLEGQLQATARPAPQVGPPVSSEQLADALAESENDGWDIMAWASNNRPDLIDQVYRSWKETHPSDAALWRFRYEQALAAERQPQAAPAEPQRDEFVERLRLREQVVETVEQARGLVSEGEWEAVKPQLASAIDDPNVPLFVKEAIFSSDADHRLGGMRMLIEVARNRITAEATERAKTEEAQRSRTTKQRAQVATGSQRPVAPRQPASTEDMTKEERTAAFHEALLRTETTSVREGLTFGRQ